jgi:hypothetical protein
MSYILDALKKADRDRHPVAVPTPATVHRTPAPPSRRRRLWPWIAGAVIVVNMGVWLWLLRPAPSVPDGALVSVTLAPATSPAPAAPEQAPPSATRSAPSVPLSRLEQTPDATPRSDSPPKPETAPEKSPAPAVASAPVKPLERDPATPPASQEPPVPQEVFANLHLQVHVYSEVPAERRVFINNQKYVEGQRIDANLVIESITSDGVFVSYQGKRVLLRADQSTSR